MKVISGTLKGRTILGYNIPGTRPTMDRVKESIFAMLGEKVKGSIVLDLFAGSGNYGIESISLAANKIYFNDYNNQCTKIIQKNLETFHCQEKSIILNMDYQKCLKFLKKQNIKLDLIFLDPPYQEHIIESILITLIKFNLLNNHCQIVAEFEGDTLNEEYKDLKIIKKRTYGEKQVYIYEYKGE